MKELVLSTMVPGGALALDRFQNQTRTLVKHEQFTWDSAWKNILSIALYQKGPELSEVGSTWLDNLGDMNALRSFSPGDLKVLGNETAFFPNTWHRLHSAGGQVVSIPWSVDTRLIVYRQDLLEKTGIDSKIAFSTPEALVDTLIRLQAAGIQYPLAMATSGLAFHHLASFVWGRGGNFRSPDLKKITLVEPEARQGMHDYYRLHPFIRPGDRLLDHASADTRYMEGNAAVLLTGQWAVQRIKHSPNLSVEVKENSGYASAPGIPYLGGTYLVIWKHALHDQELIQLIDHLTSPEVMGEIFSISATFPARLDALALPPFSTDPDYQLVIECIRRGRSFHTAHRWATIELRLGAFCEQLWEDLFANPQLDLEGEIEQRTLALANHIERTVLSS